MSCIFLSDLDKSDPVIYHWRHLNTLNRSIISCDPVYNIIVKLKAKCPTPELKQNQVVHHPPKLNSLWIIPKRPKMTKGNKE